VVTAVNERKEQDDGVEAMAKAVGKIKNMEKFGVQLMVPGRVYLQEGTLLEASKVSATLKLVKAHIHISCKELLDG
jgi:hypothetical protein